MPEFDDAKSSYAAARSAAADSRTAMVAAVEQARSLARREGVARRSAGPNDKVLSDLSAQRAKADEQVKALRNAASKAEAAIRQAATDFAAFTDPVKGVSRLPDDTPIALFPLRLETRYKTVTPVTGGPPERQLWVRVFPDQVLVDSFQPEISDAELGNVTIYWTNRWRAGGDEAGKRAAWLALAKSHGAGRARWLVEQYAPDLTEEPVRAEGEQLLILRPASPVPAAELPAIAAFWQAMWSSSGGSRDVAIAALTAALGADRAQEVETTLVPVNLSDPDVRPSPAVTPRLVALDLPDPTTVPRSSDDWTRGASAWLLPERLILLGFRDGAQVLHATGQPIPADLPVGPDPSADASDQVKADSADLDVPEALRWTVDFPEAVAKGMGFIVDLPAGDAAARFDRLFVLGIRLGSDATEGASECETLIAHHQASRRGFSLLAQGSPTNNTDEARAGYTWWEDNEGAYDAFYPATPPADPAGWEMRTDGAWLAGQLGLDPAVLRNSPGYHGADQAEARAVNVALWPATLGYYMEQMMEPVFTDATVGHTRDFFNRFVIGRGSLPLFRVGRQPYGVLPATAWSRTSWWREPVYNRFAGKLGMPDSTYLDGLGKLIARGAGMWTQMAGTVAHVGAPGPDPQQTLLDIVGLHPASVEFYQRYSQSFTQYYNLMGFESELVSAPITNAGRAYVLAGLIALVDLGWQVTDTPQLPDILEKIFLKTPNLLKGDLVAPALSEAAPLPAAQTDGRNYIAWLIDAARTSHDTLRKQEGFAGVVPNAVFYMMLRHALDLGFVDGGFQLRRDLAQLSDADYRIQRREPKFIAVATPEASQSRWQMLYRPEAAVTGDATRLLGDFIPDMIVPRNLYLGRQLAALERLKDTPTARLERVFVEHLDCLSYRLDAWRMGLASAQLAYMRQDTADGFGKRGLLVGAYGWVENLAPRGETRTPAQLDPELAAIFADEAGVEPPMRDSGNRGHIHAPSLDHAVTAAILRNGYLVNAAPAEPGLLAVDLSSARVRIAERVIEGMRAGQSLGALLGYQLERALHDEPGLFLDRLIYDLRAAFPLVGNRNLKTRLAAVHRITEVEARNVVDGVVFSEHIETTGQTHYPYGLTGLTALSEFTGAGLPGAAEIGTLIDGHVAMMRSIGDAVADIGVSEGVYQIVRGNHDRAAGSLDAFSKGDYPPEIEVTATPRSGRTLTHRVSLHLQGGVAPTGSRPRAVGEPALAAWLAGQMPDLATVFARVSWHQGATEVVLTPSMADLGLAPADLFYLLDAGGANDMAGFDDLLIDHAETSATPPPHDAVFALAYKPDGVAGLTLFELAPLVRALRGAVLGARPLRPTDLALQDEASRADDATLLPCADKVQAVRAALALTQPAIDAVLGAIDAATGPAIDPEVASDAARDTVDQWIGDYRAAVQPVAPFGLQAASLTAAVEGRRRPFVLMRDAIDTVLERWTRKEGEYDATMADYAALPATASDAERTALLIRAQGQISTVVIAPLPATVALLDDEVTSQRATFDASRASLQAMRGDTQTTGALLVAITGFMPQLAAIDATPFDLAALRASVLALARDIASRATALTQDVTRRIAEADTALAAAAAATGDRAQAQVVTAAQALLGSAFMVLPEFTLAPARLAEWDKAWTERTDILAHLTTATDGTPYPLDDWLHGVARVRERLRAVELAGLLGPALGAAGGLTLDAVQLPYRAQDVWLGLRFPDTFRDGMAFALEASKLLYTAHFGPGAEIAPGDPARSYCGLMLDEWVEVVPGTEETTGLAFHYDRPSTEAPQAVLLVTPPQHRGAWAWDDIVGALGETLDMARLRAVEPAQIDQSTLAPLLPATLSAVTTFPITAMLNYAINNNLHMSLAEQKP